MIFLALAVALGVGSFMAAAPAKNAQDFQGGTGVEEEDWGVPGEAPVYSAAENTGPEGAPSTGYSPSRDVWSAASNGDAEDAAARAGVRFDRNRLHRDLMDSVDGTPVYGGTASGDKFSRLPMQQGRKYVVGSYVPAPAGGNEDGGKLQSALAYFMKPFKGKYSGGGDIDWTKRMADIWQSPLEGHRRITSRFGYRRFVKDGKMHEGFHAGMDLAVPVGTPVYAARPGEVIATGKQKRGGKYVVIRHADGYTTRYCHLSRIDVRKGQVITNRVPIALSGNTGFSTGPHLHFAVRKPGDAGSVDPAKLISA